MPPSKLDPDSWDAHRLYVLDNMRQLHAKINWLIGQNWVLMVGVVLTGLKAFVEK